MRTLTLAALALRSFRNIRSANVRFGPGFNVISGDNGQGKSNLLEAVYAVATSRSFRGARPVDMVEHGQDVASVRASVVEQGDAREQTLTIDAGRRLARIDGKRPGTLAEYAVRSPAVVFHPGEIALSAGSGIERRRLLDRLSLYASPAASGHLDMYSRALRERQRAIESRGPSARDAPQWEALMVEHGLEVRRARAEAAQMLAEGARAAFCRIAAPGTSLAVAYAPAAPEDPETFRRDLAANRLADARRGSAAVGPHRDDLSLVLDGRPVRGFASQGQHRAIVLSLKSAEVDVVARATGVRPLLLLDDVSSELDRARTSALFEHLGAHEGQVFLTTTRPDLIEIARGEGQVRTDFIVRSGRMSAEPEASPAGPEMGVRRAL